MADELYTGSNVELIPYSQDEIQKEVENILLDKGLSDILYPGSNISQVSNVMTYLIHTLNTNTAMNLEEVLLPLAQKRMNVLWGARQLGYEPRQRVSYIYTINMIAKKNPAFGQNPGEPGYDTPFVYNLPKYTKFISGANSYYYFNDKDTGDITNEMIDNEDIATIINITVKEGNLIQFKDNKLLSQRAFNIVNDEGEIRVKQNYLIPFDNIEQDGMEVFLTYIDENNQPHVRELWSKSDYFLVDDSYSIDEKKYVRLQNIFLDMPEIYFEVGGIGPQIRLNTLIETNILQSAGASGAAGGIFEIEDPELAAQWKINTINEYQSGSDIEATYNIRENAPLFNNSANRLVTASDYVAMTQRHDKVKRAICWGAEEETTKSAGDVYLAMTPNRTIKEYKSIIAPDDNTYDPAQKYYNLQWVPGHPDSENYQSEFDLGSDDATTDTLLPTQAEVDALPNGSYWTVTFVDTNNDGSIDIIATTEHTHLHGQLIYLNDYLYVKEAIDGTKTLEISKFSEIIIGDIRKQLRNWYLEADTDILDKGQIIDSNLMPSAVFLYLKPFMIMSLKSYYRQPVYCDFEFKIDLIQEDLSLAKREINIEIFNIIENYFKYNIEKFDSQFLGSKLLSRIIDLSDNIDGLNMSLNNKLVINPIMYDPYEKMLSINNKNIHISLAFPFEPIYDFTNNNKLNTTFLPQISSLMPDVDLFVDFDGFWAGMNTPEDPITTEPTSSNDLIATTIHLGTDNTGPIIGYYFIRNDYRMNIEIQLFFSEDGTIISNSNPDLIKYIDMTGKELGANITEYKFFTDNSYGYLDLIYPNIETTVWTTPEKGMNIPFSDYMIPRLYSVEFI